MGSKKKDKSTKQSHERLHSPPPRLPITLPELHPFDQKRDLPVLALLFVGVLALYAASAPRAVMLEDDGFFISAAWFASIAHPPGYPLYVLLGWLATHIPLGSIPWRMHTLSGLMGALTCVCVAWIVLRRTGHRPAACIAGAALAVSEHFWSQAIIADVYTTNTAVLFLILALVQEAAVRRETRLWVAAAVLYGLGLANHYPLLILGSPVLLAWVVAARRDFWGRLYYLAPITILSSALLYGWMVWRSHQALPVAFLGPIRSWDEFVAYFNRNFYAGIDTNLNAGLGDKMQFATYFVTEALLQFGVAGSLLALWGGGRLAISRAGWRLTLTGEALAIVTSSFLLIAMLSFNYEFFWIAVFRPYPLIAYSMLALWLGYGIHALAQILRNRSGPMIPVLYAASGLVIVTLCLWNGRINFRPHDMFAHDQAVMTLDLVEENAALITQGDGYVAPIGYLHHVEGQRPDLRVLAYNGVFFNDRIIQPYWDDRQRQVAWSRFFRETERPVYYLGSVPGEKGYLNLGFVNKFTDTVPAGSAMVVENDRAKEYFKNLATMPPPEDDWIAVQRNAQAELYGRYLGGVLATNHPRLNKYIEDILPLAESNYWTLINMCNALLGKEDPSYLQTLSSYVHKAKQLAGNDRSKTQRATAIYLEGLIEQRKGNIGKAKALFRDVLTIDRFFANSLGASTRASFLKFVGSGR